MDENASKVQCMKAFKKWEIYSSKIKKRKLCSKISKGRKSGMIDNLMAIDFQTVNNN